MTYHMKNQIIDEVKKLKQIRLSLALPQQKLANELGVSISTVARWESGKSRPGNLALEKIRRFIAKYKRNQAKESKSKLLTSEVV